MESTTPLGVGLKLGYGLGLAAEGIKTGAFNIFLLFFYQQLVGLDPALCGLALFLSLCADAVLDPVIGAWSDSFRSRLGRRHPFMYASIVPMTLSYVLVFLPPSGMGEAGKFLWLLGFAVATRVSMALFVIPHQSLVPELTPDSGERAALTSLRVVAAWIFGLLSSLLGYTVFLKSTPTHPHGLLNAAGYPPFALCGAGLMFVAMLVSALCTQRAALARASAGHEVHFGLRELPQAMTRALRSPSYRAAVTAGLFLFVGYGMAENLNNYINTFFWGFSSQQIGGFIVVIFCASMSVLAVARPLFTRFGSRKVGMGCALLTAIVGPVMITLRLLGFMPEVGHPRLYALLCGAAFFIYASLMLSMTVVGKMIADVTDEHELITGARQEGLLFSASMFLTKAASGFGTLASGVIIKAAQIPENASLENVAPSSIRNLGIGAALASVAFGMITFYFYSRFRLTPGQHAEIVERLRQRRASSATQPVSAQPTLLSAAASE